MSGSEGVTIILEGGWKLQHDKPSFLTFSDPAGILFYSQVNLIDSSETKSVSLSM